MEGEGEKGKRRMIKLWCASLRKIVQISACDNQKLDLGSISRLFGLDPNTLMLNGHFISRGPDFIASTVTWKSLIGFFSARGLPTGATDSDALLVDGKFSKIGSKTFFIFIFFSFNKYSTGSSELEDAGFTISSTEEQSYGGEKKRPHLKNKDIKWSYNSSGNSLFVFRIFLLCFGSDTIEHQAVTIPATWI
ncbi:hypothetical protein MIMGU_mgv1a024359mg [Erythranthe guttata]|uniref:Uncharacterized protein n=1 Tax=Erythranthe guttata TaxID=4155 RepID=A0A022RHD7_ERYGU|nr:hypothetical protein MIMGU_mgv1a024359mg [Erythranthe guttata]